MFKIAICDDDNFICSQLEDILLDYSKDTGLFMDVNIFNDGMRHNLHSGLV